MTVPVSTTLLVVFVFMLVSLCVLSGLSTLLVVTWQVQNLFAGVVDMVVIGVNEVANWAKLQVFEFERLEYQGQGFHDVVAVVVAQDDVARLGFLHALGNLAGGNALPI